MPRQQAQRWQAPPAPTLRISWTGSPVTVSAASGTNVTSVQIGSAPLLHLLAERVNISGPSSHQMIGIGGASGLQFLGHSQAIARLGSGVRVSSGAGSFQYGHLHLKLKSAGSSGVPFNRSSGQWNGGEPAFAGFRFQTNTNSSTADLRYGWLELKIDMDADNYPDAVTLLAAAYDDAGLAVTTPVTTPEPGTAGLALLALGAAGVTALRRAWQQRQTQPHLRS